MKYENKWTDKELRLLKASYGKVPNSKLAAILGKTPTALASKVHYLRKRGWTFNA
jgi:biotin operon repressor